MHGDSSGDAIKRAVKCLQPILARSVRMLLHPRLVDLHDVCARREQILDFIVNRGGVIEDHRLVRFVDFILRLLGHREESGHSHVYRSIRLGPRELQVSQLYGICPADLAGHARDRNRLAATIQRRAGVCGVDALERRCKAVGITFAALLAISDDVEPRALLVANGEKRRLVLLFLELLCTDQPEIIYSNARYHLGQTCAVDKPIRLWIRTDERGRKQLGWHLYFDNSARTMFAPSTMAHSFP